jgi:hypothetical protein
MTSTSLRDLANVPHPAGVTFVDDWVDVECGDPHRYFRGSSWAVERDDSDKDLSVLIDGAQRPDGRVKRFILVAEGDTEALSELTSDYARQLGAALIAAADEVKGYTPITDEGVTPVVNPRNTGGLG